MSEENLKAYEIGFLLKSEADAQKLVDHLKRFGAEIIYQGGVKSLKLAYPIEHLPSAYFGFSLFKINPEAITNLNDALKLDSQIIRFLIVTPPFVKDERDKDYIPSASTPPRPVAKNILESRPTEEITISNDLLEEKLEEILNK